MRILLLFSLLAWCATVSAQDADVRTLRAGDTALQVAVIGVSDRDREEMLQRWLAEAAQAPLTVSSRFPLRQAGVEIRQIQSNDPSPVPWGQTARQDDVRVLLYVRGDATLGQLRGDWTAVHELSHLFHPYLGRRGRWLAEGLASYYQDVLRARIGALTGEEAWQRLDGGFARGERSRADGPLDTLGRAGTMRTYWAGAAYWLEADLALRKRGSSLDAVLADYARCCLRGTDQVAPRDFVAALDRIAGGDTFARLYARFAKSTEFPSLDDAYRQLGITRSKNDLHFSREDNAARLRAAIMQPRSAPTTDSTPHPD